MTKKLTTAIARDMVSRIEALLEQISAIYAEANTYDGMGNSNIIRDAVAARKEQREAEYSVDALLGSFDVEGLTMTETVKERTPWVVKSWADGRVWIEDGEWTVCRFYVERDDGSISISPNAEANAAYIVRACNAFPDVLAALKALSDAADAEAVTYGEYRRVADDEYANGDAVRRVGDAYIKAVLRTGEAVKTARAALAAAGGAP